LFCGACSVVAAATGRGFKSHRPDSDGLHTVQPIGIEQVSSRTVEQEKEAKPQRVSRLELAAILLCFVLRTLASQINTAR